MTTINEFHAKANAFFRGGPARARALEATARARPPPVLPVQILIESMPRLSRNERRLAKRNERRRLRKKDT
jgi:hypothetical protein